MTHICFVSPGAYTLFKQGGCSHVVGPDVHHYILGKELKKLGFEVTFIVASDEENIDGCIDGITLVKSYSLSDVSLFEKMLFLWKSMRSVDADIYYHQGGQGGIVALFSVLHSKRFFYYVASDALANRHIISEKIPEFSHSFFSVSSLSNLLSIKLSSVVFTQTLFQKKEIEKKYGIGCIVLPMPYHLERKTSFKKKQNFVLWVGSISPVKQPEIFLNLAKFLPDLRFVMIGGHYQNKELFDTICKDAERIPNLEFLGPVPFDDIDDYFSRASLLVNTSLFEGFPNAFIQAFFSKTPVVSLHSNPDSILTKYSIGLHSKSFDQLQEDVRRLMSDKKSRRNMGDDGYEYAKNVHEVSTVVKKIILPHLR